MKKERRKIKIIRKVKKSDFIEYLGVWFAISFVINGIIGVIIAGIYTAINGENILSYVIILIVIISFIESLLLSSLTKEDKIEEKSEIVEVQYE